LLGILLILSFCATASGRDRYSHQENVTFCVLPLEYAHAEQLADVLAPFLSPQGRIVAYPPTNALIIKDYPSVVRMLIQAIKGKSDLSECQELEHVAEGRNEIP
jgi:type II secretory pathway component GspD/PulD (secretin)